MSAPQDIGRVLAVHQEPHDASALPTGLVCELETPRTYAEARSGPLNHLCAGAMSKERAGHQAAGTFMPVADGGGSTGNRS